MSFLLLCCFILISSCASEPKTASKEEPIFGKSIEQPCTLYSDGSYFAGMGIGRAMEKDEAKNKALIDARTFCSLLVKHSYKGMVSNFMQSMGHNNATDIESKVSMAGDSVIEAELEDATPTCLEYAKGGDDGSIEAYISIKINKKELSSKIAKKVDQVLTPSEKEQINYDEDNYRKKMEKAFEKETGK